ncbi:MAG: hypothetical protein JJU29_00920 [Verrucomicrobia bacterium]|nr:hypothetical protein [Verrucomicrobiota bacterium]MCH8510531.1 hypothetical protein [Kiritimatiellia bacterium]
MIYPKKSFFDKTSFYIPRQKAREPRPRSEGSALLVTLLVISLLLVMTLTFVTVVRMELRGVTNHQQELQARSHARLAMELAIGELQLRAGADQRVTSTAAASGNTTHPHWTGVWSPDDAAPSWLVSGGMDVNPSANLSEAAVTLVPADPTDANSRAVQAELVGLPGTNNRIAWWVGDEGVKARVDVVKPNDNPSAQGERSVRAQSPSEPDFLSLGAPFDDETPNPLTGYSNSMLFERGNNAMLDRFSSRDTLGMAIQGVQSRTLFHDLTVFGYGLPVNVKDGGLKTDWSVVLDRSMEETELVDYYMGARPNRNQVPNHYNADIFAFPENQVFNEDRFFLTDRIGGNAGYVNLRPGPNLGILWHYGRLWRAVNASNTISMVGVYPRVASHLRDHDWLPYENEDDGAHENDIQHTNSSVQPVLSHLRFGIRLTAEPTTMVHTPANPAEGIEEVIGPGYEMQMQLKPLIGIWNPYNVSIASNSYRFEWLATPMVKIRVTQPNGSVDEHICFLRRFWSGAVGSERWMQLWARNVTFQPGEVRLFSVDQPNDQTDTPSHGRIRAVDLTSNWSSDGYILVNFVSGTSQTSALKVLPGSTVEILDVYMQDTHHPDTQNAGFGLSEKTAMSWITFKSRPAGSNQSDVFMSRYTGLWNGGVANQAAGASDFVIPQPIRNGQTLFPPFQVDDLATNAEHLSTWSFHLRTTTQTEDPEQRVRGWVDTDPRALVWNSAWDGQQAFGPTAPDGWNYVGPLMGEGPGNRGLVAQALQGNEAPQSWNGSGRYQGFMGASTTTTGQTHVPLFDVPKAPLVSVGQFQHAQLGRYSFEPGFVAGNSYANVRIPLNQTVAQNYNGIQGLDLYDISFDVNERIWDEMFFSTMAPDYVGGGNSFDAAFQGRLDRLPNPRMVYVPIRGEPSLDQVLASAGTNGQRGAEALSSRIRVMGAFNVNSTSKTAWKAVLSSMVTAELPVVNVTSGATMSWESPEAIRFNRFGHVISAQSFESGEQGHEGFWRGWRKLTSSELDALAEAIVEEVEARGPFRSMAEFVNRHPDSSNPDHQRKGALQAALDRTVNVQGGDLPDSIGGTAMRPRGNHFHAAMDGESEAVGYASYLLQGDLLQALAPILSARSDTFVIRAYSELGGNGESPTARVWCEAVVQRTAEYVEPSDEPWRNPVDDTLHPLNERFGRRFEMVAFRWLDSSELEDAN